MRAKACGDSRRASQEEMMSTYLSNSTEESQALELAQEALRHSYQRRIRQLMISAGIMGAMIAVAGTAVIYVLSP